MGRTQAERKADTRARLLASAADLFATEGFHAVSTDAVADAADRTSGALYAHFGGKQGLLTALVHENEDAAVDDITEALAGIDEPAGRVEALWAAFAARAVTDPRWLLLEHELWLWAARHPDADDAAGAARRYEAGRSSIAAAIDGWADDDHPLPIDAEPLASLVLALLLGLDMQRRLDPTAITDDTAIAGLRLLLGTD